MNYIELINRFWQCNIERCISPNDTRLYFYLLHTCNSLGWKQPFGHSDRHLSLALGMSVNTVRDGKNRLKQIGLIDFKAPEKASKGIGGQTKFLFPSVSIVDMVSNMDVDMDVDRVSDRDVDMVSDTNNKLNKTKLNILTNIKNAGEDFSEQEENSSVLKSKKKEKEKSCEKKEKVKIPQISDFLGYVEELYQKNNLGDFSLFKFGVTAKYNQWLEDGWKDGNGKPIKNWKTKIQNVIPFLKPNYGANNRNNQNDTNGTRANTGNTNGGKGGKISAHQLLARGLEEATTSDNDSENITIEVEALQ